MPSPVSRLAALLGLALGNVACHSVAGDALRPAVLVEDGAQAREAITEVLLRVTRDGRVSFGTSDLAREPLIVVQPPPPGPFEGNSPAMPIYFDLVTDGKACFLRERPATGAARDRADRVHPLPGVRCRAK